MNSRKLTHIDKGNPRMIDVSKKNCTIRKAQAEGIVTLSEEIFEYLEKQELIVEKGAVFQTSVIAGIMAAKKCHELIPMCHPISLDHCNIQINVLAGFRVRIIASTQGYGKTGVEMEALTAVSVAALTIYDMCKALSHNITVENISLLEKTGGKKDFKRNK